MRFIKDLRSISGSHLSAIIDRIPLVLCMMYKLATNCDVKVDLQRHEALKL